jgi:hypothetical protein
LWHGLRLAALFERKVSRPMMKPLLSSCLFALLIVACDTRPATEGAPSATATPPTTPPATAMATGAATAATGPMPQVDPLETEIVAATNKWNDALTRHDADALKNIYASKLRLYTIETTRDDAVKTKADAFKTTGKDYTQSISYLEVDVRKKAEPRAVFNKKWTAGGKEQQVRASLTFTKEAGKWMIKEESDAPSDQRRLRAAQNADGCEALVQKLASSTPEAKRILTSPTNPAKGHLSNGTRIGGGPPEQDKYSIAVHETHDDHYATLMWIDVDPKTGAMTSALDDKPLQGSPDLVEKVKAACK